MDRLEIKEIQDAFAVPLEEFVRETGVRLAVLINRSGQVLAQHGFDKLFDLVGVASLAAGINASSRALATQLGEDEFEHLHHAGRARQLFLAHFNSSAGQMMLVTVFDERSSIGLVRLFFADFVNRIGDLPTTSLARAVAEVGDFEEELEASLDRFFQDLIGN